MHCVTKFDIEKQCNKYVWKELTQKLQEKVEEYNHTKDKETWYEIISNLPSGFILGATMTTNYRQLKTIYKQRKSYLEKLNNYKALKPITWVGKNSLIVYGVHYFLYPAVFIIISIILS